MYQSDWLLRQIEQMGDVLKRLLSALREHRPQDAVALSREAVGELLDTDPDLIDSLSGEGLVALLSAGGMDTFRAHMLGELLVARAGALAEMGRQAEAALEAKRAATLLEALLPYVDAPEFQRIRDLLTWLESE